MQAYLGWGSIIIILALVLTKILILKKQGITAFVFGKSDKRDLLIPPIVLLFFYQLTTYVFALPPLINNQRLNERLFELNLVSWLGVILCFGAVVILFMALISFRRSFRIGVDQEHPDQLITTGIFALSRNPIYVAFALLLSGLWFVFPTPLWLLAWLGGLALLHRQVLIEERYLTYHYGQAYLEYQQKTRRYL